LDALTALQEAQLGRAVSSYRHSCLSLVKATQQAQAARAQPLPASQPHHMQVQDQQLQVSAAAVLGWAQHQSKHSSVAEVKQVENAGLLKPSHRAACTQCYA